MGRLGRARAPRALQPGERYRIDNEATTTAMIMQTGAPARQDSYDQIAGGLAERLRGDRHSAARSGAPITVERGTSGARSTSGAPRESPFPRGRRAAPGATSPTSSRRRSRTPRRGRELRSRGRGWPRPRSPSAGASSATSTTAPSSGSSCSRSRCGSPSRAATARAPRSARGAPAELAAALEELRELARGIHPAVLTERGLVVAIEGLLARAPLPVRGSRAGVHGAAVGRGRGRRLLRRRRGADERGEVRRGELRATVRGGRERRGADLGRGRGRRRRRCERRPTGSGLPGSPTGWRHSAAGSRCAARRERGRSYGQRSLPAAVRTRPA